MCKKVKKAQRIENSNNEASRANEGNPWFKDNWKIVFGVVFLIGGIGNIGKDNGTAVIAIIVGIGLVFAHFYPMVKAKKLEKAEKEAEQKAKEEELKAIADEIKFCKTCGAKTKGSFCEYCGSKLE